MNRSETRRAPRPQRPPASQLAMAHSPNVSDDSEKLSESDMIQPEAKTLKFWNRKRDVVGGNREAGDGEDDILPGVATPELNRLSTENDIETPVGRLMDPDASFRRVGNKISTSDTIDPLGLNLLFAPENPLVDFIFVHGHEAGSQTTWSYEKDPTRCWPKYWLTQDPAFKNVRVHSFGYSTRQAENPNKRLKLYDIAHSLLADIQHGPHTGSGNTTPIVLIGHGVGGWIIKELYIIARQSLRYFPCRIRSIVFIATPHSARGFSPFMCDIPEVNTINDKFSYLLAPYLHVHSFYFALDERCSDFLLIGRSGNTQERNTPLKSSPYEMCRFESQHDTDYFRVRNTLASVTTEIIWKEKFQKDLREISYPEQYLQSHKIRPVEGSFKWLVESDTFCGWRDNAWRWEDSKEPNNKILWLHGQQGCGKSVLAAQIIESLQELELDCSYFFFPSDMNLTLEDCVRSLLFQTASMKFRDAKIIRYNDPGIRISEWEQLFLDGLFPVSVHRPQYWIIDGLDNCRDRSKLLFLLRKIDGHVPLCVLITSRLTPSDFTPEWVADSDRTPVSSPVLAPTVVSQPDVDWLASSPINLSFSLIAHSPSIPQDVVNPQLRKALSAANHGGLGVGPHVPKLATKSGPGQITCKEISLRDTNSDMELYVTEKLKELDNLDFPNVNRAELRSRIIKQADGSFEWACRVLWKLERAHNKFHISEILADRDFIDSGVFSDDISADPFSAKGITGRFAYIKNAFGFSGRESADGGGKGQLKYPSQDLSTTAILQYQAKGSNGPDERTRQDPLLDFISEIAFVPRDHLLHASIEERPPIGFLNRVQSGLEGYTKQSWDWWPLQQPLASDTMKLSLACHCGHSKNACVETRAFGEYLSSRDRKQRTFPKEDTTVPTNEEKGVSVISGDSETLADENTESSNVSESPPNTISSTDVNHAPSTPRSSFSIVACPVCKCLLRLVNSCTSCNGTGVIVSNDDPGESTKSAPKPRAESPAMKPSTIPSSASTVQPSLSVPAPTQRQTTSPMASGRNGPVQNSSPEENQADLKSTLRRVTASNATPNTVGVGSHVLLGINIGYQLNLVQIDRDSCADDSQFFAKLKKEYNRERGFLRRCLGVKQYHHCEFVEVSIQNPHNKFKLTTSPFEKPCYRRIIKRGKGYPHDYPQHLIYYRYRPINSQPQWKDPPILPDEFYDRYHGCSNCMVLGSRYLHNCSRFCPTTIERVERIPKRTEPLALETQGQEEAWGLHAVEYVSTVRVVLYHVFMLVGPLVFWGLWLGYWGKEGDLQNASVPFLCMVPVFSMFWALLKGDDFERRGV